jgi:hypothetical protein
MVLRYVDICERNILPLSSRLKWQPWWRRQYGPHDVTTQKINIDNFTAMRTSDLICWYLFFDYKIKDAHICESVVVKTDRWHAVQDSHILRLQQWMILSSRFYVLVSFHFQENRFVWCKKVCLYEMQTLTFYVVPTYA